MADDTKVHPLLLCCGCCFVFFSATRNDSKVLVVRPMQDCSDDVVVAEDLVVRR